MTTKKSTGMQTNNGAKEKGKKAPAKAEKKNPPKMRITTTPMTMGRSCSGFGPRRGAAGYHDWGAGGGWTTRGNGRRA